MTIEDRVTRVETVIEEILRRLDRLDARLDRLESKIDKLDAKLDNRFLWMMGTYIATLLTVVGALLLGK
jgi:hypothetical protein